jgi:asparagine N-glycosylation enzyme membrane subunit Stt3
VVESGSSLVTGGVFDLSHPYAWLSGFFFAMPVALFLLGRELHASGWQDRGRLLLLATGALLFAMAVLQRRFAEPFAPLQAILAADLLRRLHARLAERGSAAAAPAGTEGRSRQKRRRAQRKAAEHPAGQPKAPSLIPAAVVGLAVLSAYAGTPGGYSAALAADTRYNTETYADLQRFALWLDTQSGPTAPGVPRAEGALSLWDLGHRILYVTHLPVVGNNFGLHIGLDSWHDSAAFFVESDEAQALAALEARRVRYVVADYDVATAQLLVGYVEGQPAEYFETVKDGSGTATLMKPAFTRTLYFRMGSSHMGSQGVSRYPDGRELPIEPLQHFRLVLETEQREAIRPLRIFERVAGAHLRVRGVPPDGLGLTYAWRTPAGREHRYRLMLPASAGLVEALLPYSSERPELGQSAEYRLEAKDGRWLALRVAEADVKAGRVLEADWSAAQAKP